jgi:mevalonate kinase
MGYPAKILLFGEYGIILNSMALAIPYPRFSGRFRFSATSPGLSRTETESNEVLKKLLLFLKSNDDDFRYFNLPRFETEINHGLYFDSTIPVSAGLGSSGALTAALYERYSTQLHYNPEYRSIKSDLAAIENFFHGESSGFDPLTSLLKKPVLMEDQTLLITTTDLSPFLSTYTIFLINTHSNGNTGKLVNYFREQYRLRDFNKIINNQYIPVINQTIKAVTEVDFGSFDQLIPRYSEFQLTNFGEMIPREMHTYFKYGIDSGDFHLKLCGSGGGGYILGFARDRLKAESYFNLNHLDWTVV